jgi:hypothetical protein
MKKKRSLLRDSNGNIIPSKEMVLKVDRMLKNLDGLAGPASILQGCPEAPGIVLEKSIVTPLDRESKNYKKIVKEYEKIRPQFLAALASHPVGKSLSLLAVGKEGLELMKKGKVPKKNLGTILDEDGIRRNAIAFYNVKRLRQSRLETIQDSYNCHHIIQKSVLSKNHPSPNDPSNLVLVQTFKSNNNQMNPHHFWHAIFLHPQINGNTQTPQPFYAVRPLFPIYPPIQKPIHSVEQLRKELKILDPQATLPLSWENKIVAFSRLIGEQPYQIDQKYRKAIKLFQKIHSKENKEPSKNLHIRNLAAKEASCFAKDWLPAGAIINGIKLPSNHKPKFILPIIKSENKMKWEVASSRFYTKDNELKNQALYR